MVYKLLLGDFYMTYTVLYNYIADSMLRLKQQQLASHNACAQSSIPSLPQIQDQEGMFPLMIIT